MITAISFANRYLSPYKINGREHSPIYCPFCDGGERNDKHTFYFNIDKKTYQCFRGKCGAKGNFYQLLKKFNVQEQEMEQTKTYIKPKNDFIEPTSKLENYFSKRGIKKEVYSNYVKEKNNTIVFPFYENKELVMVKYRSMQNVKNKEWREKGGKSVFWNMDNCDFTQPLIITEGMIDALSVIQSGYKNTVSLPSGTNDLNCIDNNWDWINKFEKIIIWTDRDSAGLKCQINLIKRLGEWRCFNVHSTQKDANDVLKYKGVDEVRKVIEGAYPVPMEDLVNLSDIKRVDYSKLPKVLSGFDKFDEVLGGFLFGDVSIWTGINGGGKSTFLGQILLNSINQGYPVCAYSGELSSSLFKYWIDLQATGSKYLQKKHNEIKKKDIPIVPNEVSDCLSQWYYKKFLLLTSLNKKLSVKEMFKKFEYAVRRYNCKVLLIDNLMMMTLSSGKEDKYALQGEFVNQVKSFAEKFNVHIHLVAHPRKAHGRINKMDISGTADITNLADNVLGVHRLTQTEKDNEVKYLGVENVVDIFKNRFDGIQETEIRFDFDTFSKRFFSLNQKEEEIVYGWQKYLK